MITGCPQSARPFLSSPPAVPRLRLRVRPSIRPQISLRAANSDLKQKLIDTILQTKPDSESFTAGLPPEAQKIIDQMAADAQKTQVELKEEDLLGNFDGVASRFTALNEAGVTSLGQYSFMQFKPTDLKVKMTGGGTVTNKMKDSEPYAIISHFRVAEGEHEGVEGTQKAIAEWSIDEKDPARMYVTFVRTQIEPKQQGSEALERWKAAFKDANPLMDDNGMWVQTFEKGRTGTRDFVYVDKDFQVSRGNRGSWTVLERRD